MCHSPGCEAGWFLCEIGHPCIAKESVCDGTKDCPDASDEFVSRCGGEANSVCLSVCPFLFSLDICYQSGLCTHLFPFSELGVSELSVWQLDHLLLLFLHLCLPASWTKTCSSALALHLLN